MYIYTHVHGGGALRQGRRLPEGPGRAADGDRPPPRCGPTSITIIMTIIIIIIISIIIIIIIIVKPLSR